MQSTNVKRIVYVGGPEDGKEAEIVSERGLPPAVRVNTVENEALHRIEETIPATVPVVSHLYTLSVIYPAGARLNALYAYRGVC